MHAGRLPGAVFVVACLCVAGTCMALPVRTPAAHASAATHVYTGTANASAPSPDPRAPNRFRVDIVTDIDGGATIVLEVTRAWAPLGVDRFYALLQDQFYDDAAFFRVVPNFVLQFGIAGTPEQNGRWATPILDDPVLESNLQGTLTYATAGANTRTTQLFINYEDNPGLDTQGFAPFAKVLSGMDAAVRVFNPTPGNSGGVDQASYTTLGNAWIRQEYPGINFITRARAIEWRVEARMPTARLGLAAAATEERIYALGGDLFNINQDVAQSMDLATGVWRDEPPMPLARWQAAAVATAGKVYTLGGFEGNAPLDSVVSLDVATGVWHTEASLPTARALLSAVALEGRVFALGGRTEDPFNPVTATVESMDVASGVWRTDVPMPSPRQGAASVALDGRIYVIGGGNGNGPELDTVDVFDLGAGEWRAEQPMSVPRTLLSAAVIGGRIYVVGGVGPVGAGVTVESFDVATDTWQMEESLPDDRWQSATVAGGGRVYAVGGNSPGGALATVVSFDAADAVAGRQAGGIFNSSRR